jgi:Fe-S oxidoreductase
MSSVPFPTEFVLARVVYLFLFILTLVIFLRRLYFVYSVIRIGKGELSDRLRDLPHRIVIGIKHVLLQTRHIDEPVGGIAHGLIFWGFIVYLISYLNDPFLRGLFPDYSIPILESYYFIFLKDVAGVAVLIGVALALYRRAIMKPESLENTRDAWLTLALITAVISLSYVFSATSMALQGDLGLPAISSFLGSVMDDSLAIQLYYVSWWLHTILLFFFMVFIVYSKHLHMLLSPFSVLAMEIRGNGFLEKKEIEGEEESYGAEKLNEFHWRELLNGFVCANCGRCDRVCPAFNTSSKLSPRALIYKELRKYAFNEGSRYLKGEKDIKSMLEGYVTPEEVWDCYFCIACSTVCPVFNEHYRVLIQLRRKLLEAGELDPGMQDVLMSFYRYGNSFMKPPKERASWTNKLDFKVKDASKEEVEYLWYVGDYASFHPMLQRVTRTVALVLKKLDVDYGILYSAEQNAGNDLRRMGEEGLFEMLVDKNKEVLSRAKFKRILTTDPHTYNVLRNEYPLYGASYETYHHTELFERTIKDEEVGRRLNYTATYHDPCYLGRYNDIYETPRRIMRKLGIRVVEMRRSKERSFCCGAGGGLIWRSEERKGKRPAILRVEEAVRTGAELLVVSCPKDYVMFVDAVKGAGLEGKLRVVEISELIAEALGVSPSK